MVLIHFCVLTNRYPPSPRTVTILSLLLSQDNPHLTDLSNHEPTRIGLMSGT
jgi:hypothetical protein